MNMIIIIKYSEIIIKFYRRNISLFFSQLFFPQKSDISLK